MDGLKIIQEKIVFKNTFANVQNECSYRVITSWPLGNYDARVAAELMCFSDAKDDVIAEYAAAGLEFVDEFEDALFERV